jgi:hypothetical protein
MLTYISDRLLHPVSVFAVFYIALLFLCYEAIHFPPYWDSVLGLFAEATWLADHDFDYMALAYGQYGYVAGGPRVYFFSIYPSLQALLMIGFDNASRFLLFNHLLTLGYAAATLSAFYYLLRVRVGSALALLGAIALMVHPLFRAQAEAINMEMPLLAATSIGILLTIRGRHLWGAVFAIAAMAVKPFGIIGVVALLIYHLVDREQGRRRNRAALSLLGLSILSAPAQLWLRSTFLEDSSDTLFVLFRGSLKAVIVDLVDFLILFVIGVVFCGIYIYGYLQKDTAGGFLTRFGDTLGFRGHGDRRADLIIILFFVSFGAFFIHIVNILPRYLLYCLPVLLYMAIVVLSGITNRRWLRGVVVSAIICLSLFNQNGLFYPAIQANNGFMLERSLEYRNDLKLNNALISYLERNHRDEKIVTSWPLAQMLTMPRLGYVTKPLNVLTSDRACLYAPTESVSDELPDPDRSVWVYTPNSFSRQNKYYPEDDHLLARIAEGSREAVIYRRTKW